MNSKESGITAIALIITVLVLIIIIAVIGYVGLEAIKDNEIQTIETNMITIKAKAKTYGEDIAAAIWEYSEDENISQRDEMLAEYGFEETEIADNIVEQLDEDVRYYLDEETDTEDEAEEEDDENIDEDEEKEEVYIAYTIEAMLENDELIELNDDIDEGQYIVIYNSADFTKLDVAYTEGVTYNGEIYYTLSALQGAYTE